jgi:hypothetical protein
MIKKTLWVTSGFETKWSSGALVIFLVWSGLVGSGLALVWSWGKNNQSLPVFLMLPGPGLPNGTCMVIQTEPILTHIQFADSECVDYIRISEDMIDKLIAVIIIGGIIFDHLCQP